MKYYQVKNQVDLSSGVYLIKNELITTTELKQWCKQNNLNIDKVKNTLLTEVELNKNNSYFSFGARFNTNQVR